MKKEIYETMTRTINSDIINYGYGCTIYDEAQTSGERPLTSDFLIVRVPMDKSNRGIFICAYNRCGYGFYLENVELTESIQVYRAKDDLDSYYTIKKITDKNKQSTYIKKSVFNKMELIVFLTKYFEEKESYYSSVTIESVENEFFDFIR